ncbi:hypothetical protein A2U01_0098578, partial [Trifolium medium]|nr:hypothetical protein [Trifolium medium]
LSLLAKLIVASAEYAFWIKSPKLAMFCKDTA